MLRSIDLKSVLIGGLLAAMFLCFIGAVPFAAPEKHGRFRLEANDNWAFIIDSATGQVWSSMFPNPQFKSHINPDSAFHAPKTFDADAPKN